MNQICCVLILLFLPLFVFGQSDDLIDIIYLKNRSIFKGKVLEEGEEIIKFQLRENNIELEFESEKVKKIIRDVPVFYFGDNLIKLSKIKEYAFKEKGFYQSLDVSLMLEFKEEEEMAQKGFGFRFVYGYRFNRWLGVGLGLGMDQYDLKNDDKIIPVFANLQGFMLAKRVSPMYNIDFGIGLGLYDNQFLENIKPGILFHPSLGLRLNSSERSNVTLDMGLRFQTITNNSFIIDNSGNFFEEEIVQYNRLVLRLGILF